VNQNHKNDLGVGIGTLAVSILCWVALQGDEARQMGMSAITSRTFPQVALILLFALGLALTVKETRALRKQASEKTPSPAGRQSIPARVWWVLGGTAAYLFLLRPLGFYLASGIYLVSVILYLGRGKNWLISLGITAGALLGFYLVFTVWLNLLLPRGIIF
jgi:hypothetical protein